MNVVRIGLEIAKPVFQAHGVDGRGRILVKKTPSRGGGPGCFANLAAR